MEVDSITRRQVHAPLGVSEDPVMRQGERQSSSSFVHHQWDRDAVFRRCWSLTEPILTPGGKKHWPFSAGGNTREAWQAQSWRPLHRRSTQTSRPMCRKHQSPPGSIPPTLSTGPSALWGAMSTKGSCRRSAPKAHVSKCSSVAHTQHPRGNTVLPAIKSF